VIPNISAFTFEALLQYLYCGMLNVEDVSALLDLLLAADQYGLERLKEMCRARIEANLSVCDRDF